METKTNSNGKATPEKKEAVKEVKTVDLVAIKRLESENQELKKQLDKVVKRMENKPQSLEEQIAYFEQKRQKINHLRQFEGTREKIKESQQALKEEHEKGSFTAEKHKLVFGRVNYNGELTAEAFKISNVDLLVKFTDFIMGEIQAKISQLENEIAE